MGLNCLRCELIRARASALALSALLWKPEDIAKHLSEGYGENYYVENNVIYRASKLPPFEPHVIKDYNQ